MKHVAGAFDGGHAVKLIGWGIDQGVPYWTAANSWNADWGEDGLFFELIFVEHATNISVSINF